MISIVGFIGNQKEKQEKKNMNKRDAFPLYRASLVRPPVNKTFDSDLVCISSLTF